MSRPRFLADCDLNAQIVKGVRRREPLIDFLDARREGLGRAEDNLVLDYAARNGLLVVSHDVTTMEATAYERIAQGKPMAGLFLIVQQERVRVAIDELILVWAASEAEEWNGVARYLPL